MKKDEINTHIWVTSANIVPSHSYPHHSVPRGSGFSGDTGIGPVFDQATPQGPDLSTVIYLVSFFF